MSTAQVLPEIGELQCGANGVAAAQRGRIVDAVEVQHEAPDRTRRATAIVQQFSPVGVTVPGRVLCKRTQQVGQQVKWQLMARQYYLERTEDASPTRRCRRTASHCKQFAAIGTEVGKSRFGARLAFVGDVIGGSGESIDRHHRGPQARRAQPGSDRKVFVVIHRHDSNCPWATRSSGSSQWPEFCRGLRLTSDKPASILLTGQSVAVLSAQTLSTAPPTCVLRGSKKSACHVVQIPDRRPVPGPLDSLLQAHSSQRPGACRQDREGDEPKCRSDAGVCGEVRARTSPALGFVSAARSPGARRKSAAW